jgi:[ribosomal protein S5]-alanine N-acetyltransferase
MVDVKKVKLVPASLDDYPIIQNMGRFYVYDMSEYMEEDEDWAIPKNGLFECEDFKKYWERENTYPYLVYLGEEMAGFVIVDKRGSDPKVDFNMAQFFILRRFKGKGLGTEVAFQCFDRFKGTWEVMTMPRNAGAHEFWKKVVEKYTNGQFEEYTRCVKHLGYSEQNIFRFQSRGAL